MNEIKIKYIKYGVFLIVFLVLGNFLYPKKACVEPGDKCFEYAWVLELPGSADTLVSMKLKEDESRQSADVFLFNVDYTIRFNENGGTEELLKDGEEVDLTLDPTSIFRSVTFILLLFLLLMLNLVLIILSFISSGEGGFLKGARNYLESYLGTNRLFRITHDFVRLLHGMLVGLFSKPKKTAKFIGYMLFLNALLFFIFLWLNNYILVHDVSDALAITMADKIFHTFRSSLLVFSLASVFNTGMLLLSLWVSKVLLAFALKAKSLSQLSGRLFMDVLVAMTLVTFCVLITPVIYTLVVKDNIHFGLGFMTAYEMAKMRAFPSYREVLLSVMMGMFSALFNLLYVGSIYLLALLNRFPQRFQHILVNNAIKLTRKEGVSALLLAKVGTGILDVSLIIGYI